MSNRQTIRTLRLAAGLTQKALADKLGIASISVSHWENGRNEPCVRQLIELGAVFQIPVGQINFNREAARTERNCKVQTIK